MIINSRVLRAIAATLRGVSAPELANELDFIALTLTPVDEVPE